MTEIIWKATILLAAAAIAQAALGRASASLRHFLWSATFAALLLLPPAIRTIPKWRPQPVVAFATAEPATVLTVHGGAPKPSRVSWPVLLWALGCAAAAAWFLVGAARTSWLMRRASPAPAGETAEVLRRRLGIRRKVRVLESALAPMPLTWGILRPVVSLPEKAADWPAGRLHTVLLHELIHVRRWDLLWQALAQTACCLYWFHPLAWLGLRQQRQERERACDDAVLASGVTPHEYAGHLVDLVRGMAARRVRGDRWANAPAMAQASDLELRVRDLLRRNCNRRPLSRRAALAAAGVMAAVFLPLAAFTALAQVPMSGLSGTVLDPSGAVIPNCHISVKNLDGSNEETTTTNAAGVYQFASIPAGQYTLEVNAAGFKKFTLKTVQLTGSPVTVNAQLTVGDVSEVVTVKGEAGAMAAASAVSTPQRIRVGGNVQMAQLVSQVRPDYPDELQQAGVQGVVKIRAIISKTGTVLHATVISTVDKRLSQLALDAVNQWVYQPTLLNGEPIEVLTTIDVDFSM
jgi:TonB family protein